MWVASAKLSEKLSLQVAAMAYYSYLSENSVFRKKENNICDTQRYNSTHITLSTNLQSLCTNISKIWQLTGLPELLREFLCFV